MEDPSEPDADQLRISDADRHQVAEILREAAGDGRLDLEELDERLGAAYAAKTYAELVPITHDLPAGRVPAQVGRVARVPAPTGTRHPEKHLLIMSGLERKGQWHVPEQLQLTCVMGGAELDLREATYATPEVVVTVNAVLGGASLIVGPDVDVVMEGTGIMGGFSGPTGPVERAPGAAAQTLRVRGVAFWGGVSVERKD